MMPVKMFGVTRLQPLTPDQSMRRPMSQFKPLPPLAELQDAFAYDPGTGLFTSKHARGSLKAGDSVGTLNPKGHVQMVLKGRLLSAHRVAWYLMTGLDPVDSLVDHKDRVPSHNWFSNLRVATCIQNQGNRLAKGWVCTRSGMYQAQISIGGVMVYLGNYATPEEAHDVYKAKHIEVHGSFSPYSLG